MDVIIKRAIGSTNLVATDFNPSYKIGATIKRALGSNNFVAMDFNP
ncbi:hypothetical protein [Flavobacterium sp.]|nr:hypothetical protein [Flavobacterium sp.]